MSNRGRPRSVGSYSGRGLRGGGSTPPGDRHSAHHNVPVGEDDSHAYISPIPSDGMAQGRGKVTQQKSANNRSQHFRHKPMPVSVYRPKLPSHCVDDELPHEMKLHKETDSHAYISPVPSDRMAQGRGKVTQQKSANNRSQHFRQKPMPVSVYRPKLPSHCVDDELPHEMKLHKETDAPEAGSTSSNQSNDPLASDSADKDDHAILPVQSVYMDAHPSEMRAQIVEAPSKGTKDSIAPFCALTHDLYVDCPEDELNLSSKSSKRGLPFQQKDSSTAGIGDCGPSGHLEMLKPFDICPPKPVALVTLKPSLLEKNKEIRNEKKRFMEGKKATVLRSGMVLLENYLSLDEQVQIVKACQGLGLGPGGFYQPGYRDGAQLHLKMMCLGKFWDPETSKYGDRRPIDDAKPPNIPNEFRQLVEKAIKDSHALIKVESKASNVEDILPRMTPDVCIVNFYSASGRLGLHQDRDESRESLDKRLPVVSFSIGDSCEFLYGDQRDAEKAKKVVLKSGDVLLFGGTSRHIFHGVTSIVSESAPKRFLEETNLRQGRLNLTFREY